MAYWKDQILSIKNIKFKRFSLFFYEIPSLFWEKLSRGILGTLKDTSCLFQSGAHWKGKNLSNSSEI